MDDSLHDTIQDLCSARLLTHDEELALGRIVRDTTRSDDERVDARNTLMVHNTRLVVKIARQYQHLSFLDAIQDGMFGLEKAASRFDPEKGWKFSTYATWWIRQSITRAMHNNDPIRLPVHVSETRRKIANAHARAGRELSVSELAEQLGIREKMVHSALRARSMQPMSLDAPVDVRHGNRTTNDPFTLGDVLPDPASVEQDGDDTILREHLARALTCLTEREQFIIQRRFGFGGEKPRTLVEIGEELGLTRERVRQVQEEALAKLRTVTPHLAGWIAA